MSFSRRSRPFQGRVCTFVALSFRQVLFNLFNITCLSSVGRFLIISMAIVTIGVERLASQIQLTGPYLILSDIRFPFRTINQSPSKKLRAFAVAVIGKTTQPDIHAAMLFFYCEDDGVVPKS